MSAPAFRAGAAEAVATPAAEGTFLIGPMKKSTGVSDDLYARALVLDDGDTRAVIVTLDYLGFDFEFTERLVQAAAKASDTPAPHVLLNCSHTHSAPLTAPWGPWEKEKDKPFHRMLPQKVAVVAERAAKRLQPVTLAYRREPTQIGFNRRLLHEGRITMAPNPRGTVLPWTDVLSLHSRDGQPVAVLFSYAAHPVIVHKASTLISADYPGFAVRRLKQTRGKDAVYLFAQGCCGNINGFPLQGGIDAAAAAGRDLGDAVGRAMTAKDRATVQGRLRIVSAQPKLPLQAAPPVATLREQMERERNSERKQRFADLLAIAQDGRRPTMPMPMRALAIGDAFCLLGMAHEPFAEYHHFIEKVSPLAHNMVLAYTGGLECYVGTAADYQLGERGGYETSPRGAAFMFESRLPLDARAESLIKAELTALLKQVHA